MRPMSLSQYRANVRIIGEKSALFTHRNLIFEAVEMGLSHAQIHYFLTTQKGLKISVRAISKWIKTHSKLKPKAQNFEPINKENTTVHEQKEVIKKPKVEPSDMASMAKAKLEAQAEAAGIDLSDLPQGLYSMFATQILK